MSQPLTQPTTQSETFSLPATQSAPTEEPHKLRSSTKSASQEAHHKIAVDHGHYHPEMSTTARGQLQEWIRAPIKGNLNEVPGIGPANIAHFGTVSEQNRAMGGAELIDSTYQLIGKFLMFKNRDKTNVQNCQDFFLWLKAKGLTSHVNDIVEAVAEKVNVLIPGSYSIEDYSAK